MIIREVAGKAISTEVVIPALVDSLEPNVMGKTVVPQFQRKFTEALGYSPAFMINVTYGGNIVTPN